jgi:Glycosyl hydrolases family 35
MRCSILSVTLAIVTVAVPSLAANYFNYSGTDFILNGDVYQILGGQIDPQRVPWQLWDSRLAMARAMGLNTVFLHRATGLLMETTTLRHGSRKLNNRAFMLSCVSDHIFVESTNGADFRSGYRLSQI